MEQLSLIICCLLGLYLLFRVMAAPIRLIWKLTINLACGFAVLILCNLVGSFWGITLGLNLISAVTVGLLGLPGIGLLLVLRAVL